MLNKQWLYHLLFGRHLQSVNAVCDSVTYERILGAGRNW